jgi:hypothetical protein
VGQVDPELGKGGLQGRGGADRADRRGSDPHASIPPPRGEALQR